MVFSRIVRSRVVSLPVLGTCRLAHAGARTPAPRCETTAAEALRCPGILAPALRVCGTLGRAHVRHGTGPGCSVVNAFAVPVDVGATRQRCAAFVSENCVFRARCFAGDDGAPESRLPGVVTNILKGWCVSAASSVVRELVPDSAANQECNKCDCAGSLCPHTRRTPTRQRWRKWNCVLRQA